MSLQGTLRTLGITEVLEFLADRKATGRLDIDAGTGTATYWMFRGDVSSTSYDFSGEHGSDPAEATYFALSEIDGTFIFDEDEAPPLGEPSEDVPSVLARTAAIAEQWSEIQQDIPSVHHILRRNTDIDGSVTIQPEWWKAIELVGSGTTCKAIAVALDMSPLEASTMAHEMLEAGLLVASDDIAEPVLDEPPVDDPAADEPVLDATAEPDELAVVDDVSTETETEPLADDYTHDENIEAAEPAFMLEDFASQSEPAVEPIADSGFETSVDGALEPGAVEQGAHDQGEPLVATSTVSAEAPDDSLAADAAAGQALADALLDPAAMGDVEPESANSPRTLDEISQAVEQLTGDSSGSVIDRESPVAVDSFDVASDVVADVLPEEPVASAGVMNDTLMAAAPDDGMLDSPVHVDAPDAHVAAPETLTAADVFEYAAEPALPAEPQSAPETHLAPETQLAPETHEAEDDGWASDHSKPAPQVRLEPRPASPGAASADLSAPDASAPFAPELSPFDSVAPLGSDPFNDSAAAPNPFADIAGSDLVASDDPLESLTEIIPQTSRFVGLPEPAAPGPPSDASMAELPGVVNDSFDSANFSSMDFEQHTPPPEQAEPPAPGGLNLPSLSGVDTDLGNWQMDDTFAPPPPGPDAQPVDPYNQLNDLVEEKDDRKKGKDSGGLGRFLRRD